MEREAARPMDDERNSRPLAPAEFKPLDDDNDLIDILALDQEQSRDKS